MKKTILLLALTTAFFTSQAQIKHSKKAIDTAKTVQVKKAKSYTLFINIDSTAYPQIQSEFENAFRNLDASTNSHPQVEGSKAFIKQLFELFEAEKKAQDQKPNVKKP